VMPGEFGDGLVSGNGAVSLRSGLSVLAGRLIRPQQTVPDLALARLARAADGAAPSCHGETVTA
jgi:hypothetical protein